MSSSNPGTEAQREDDSRPLWLRLALWYSTLFVLGAIAIVFVTYYLTAASLAQRDAQIIHQKLDEYAAVYARGGLRALTEVVGIEQRTAPESLFVRVVDRGVESRVLSLREGWDQATLETAFRVFPDGTLVEVGKSRESRLDVLARFRATLGLVTLLIVAIALTGGWLATQSALQPIRRLTAAVQRIIRTGRTDERVPVARRDDAINELTMLFNAMLDKIEGLVNGMRGALDNVSHDLRTPLTRLRGTAEMALAGPGDLDRYREALADCVEETDRVLMMLNTLMDISEAESGAMPLQRELVGLAEVASRAIDLYRDVADSKGVTLTANTAPDLVVVGDRVRLEQVAANLLDNAVKYTPRGGQVSVDLHRENGRAVLRVQDTGPGIPADELPRIWQRLFRGDQSRTERGLGLGLSLVKAVVEAHGGLVGVTSEVSRGSTFIVSLPAQPIPNP
jgi:signal transduction histidine kinase